MVVGLKVQGCRHSYRVNPLCFDSINVLDCAVDSFLAVREGLVHVIRCSSYSSGIDSTGASPPSAQ